MNSVSLEMISIRREIKTISLMFFSVIHPKTSNSNIIKSYEQNFNSINCSIYGKFDGRTGVGKGGIIHAGSV
jgi:hypothetical protein